MKNIPFTLICGIFLLTTSGCSVPPNTLDHLISDSTTELQEETSLNPRVYMDEISGTVKDFTGNQLILLCNSTTYSFDVSQADLECRFGIITGDEVNIIYEGQLNTTDTSTVKALKVVDSYHNKPELKEKKIYGQVQKLTSNSITLKSKGGKTATYPITGTEQYYQNGIKSGNWVYLYFRGNPGVPISDNPNFIDASHLKVLSISDIDPLKIPAPTPTPPPQETAETVTEQKLRAVISNVNMNTLQVIPDNSNTTLNLDMSTIPCHFSGGIAPDSRINITYTGKFNGTTLDGMTILGITGDIPEKLSPHSVSYTVSGEITGSTANTITILSTDGMSLTFCTDSAVNNSTGGLLTGSSVKLTFNPADSRDSNIYACIKIEDA